MGIKDPHDPREFRHFAKRDAEGQILVIVEVAEGSPAPEGDYEDITAQRVTPPKVTMH